MPLSDVACRGAKPGPKPYRKTDGGGLPLLIQPSGSKLWQWSYRHDGPTEDAVDRGLSADRSRRRTDEARRGAAPAGGRR